MVQYSVNMEQDTSPKEQFNLRIDSTLAMQTKILAIQQKRRPNAIVEEALRDLLKKYKVKG
jgi:predicted HicB family RNase H-like nuclease